MGADVREMRLAHAGEVGIEQCTLPPPSRPEEPEAPRYTRPQANYRKRAVYKAKDRRGLLAIIKGSGLGLLIWPLTGTLNLLRVLFMRVGRFDQPQPP